MTEEEKMDAAELTLKGVALCHPWASSFLRSS